MNHMSKHLQENLSYLKQSLALESNFDLVYRTIFIGGKEACFVFVDGFCKDELMEKILQFFLDITPQDRPCDPYYFLKEKMPYVEVEKSGLFATIETGVLSGVFALFLDDYPEAILIDSRTYPARDVSEPEKDKTLRGSKDGFVETLIFNTALIRRRIRSPWLRMEIFQVGTVSHTDVVLCYMQDRVDRKYLDEIKRRIRSIKRESLTMNQESLAECLYEGHWFNPFPKFQYTERPDKSTAQILEGNIAILVDNSPFCMLLPNSVFDLVEEADDYYFPPVTGTYLRICRFLIAIFAYFLTPLYLLATMYQNALPEALRFMLPMEDINVPIFLQYLIMELAIDGLRLASVNTPSMLSTPLSILAGLVLGEFSVSSGFFNQEVMLSMSFVAVANYTQPSYELGYAIKFMRLITLTATFLFGIWGFLGGVIFTFVALVTNKTVAGKSYLYPLIPFHAGKFCKHLIRTSHRSKSS